MSKGSGADLEHRVFQLESELITAKAQRDEFKRRYKNSRLALETIRTAYEKGDSATVEVQLQLSTAFTHSPIKSPRAMRLLPSGEIE